MTPSDGYIPAHGSETTSRGRTVRPVAKLSRTKQPGGSVRLLDDYVGAWGAERAAAIVLVYHRGLAH
jgi:hypothetical protein